MLAMLILMTRGICELEFFYLLYFELFHSVLHYTNLEATKDKGCTMDLLTNLRHEIVFWTGMHNRVGLDACLNGSDINSNV